MGIHVYTNISFGLAEISVYGSVLAYTTQPHEDWINMLIADINNFYSTSYESAEKEVVDWEVGYVIENWGSYVTITQQ